MKKFQLFYSLKTPLRNKVLSQRARCAKFPAEVAMNKRVFLRKLAKLDWWQNCEVIEQSRNPVFAETCARSDLVCRNPAHFFFVNFFCKKFTYSCLRFAIQIFPKQFRWSAWKAKFCFRCLARSKLNQWTRRSCLATHPLIVFIAYEF